MEHHELIAKAKTYFAGTVGRDSTPPAPNDFPHVRIRESVVVYFQSQDEKDGVWVLLDKETGKFLAGWSHIRGRSEGEIKPP